MFGLMALATKFIPFKFGIKPLKYFIDSVFRKKVTPIDGSVLYSSLYIGAEHSGIYIGKRKISNIIVDESINGVVESSTPEDFTSKSIFYKKIYVSSDKYGAVGNNLVKQGAFRHLGKVNSYNLLFDNCHVFSEKCVNYSNKNFTFNNFFTIKDIDETWEMTIGILKRQAGKKLGATKWLLWDYNSDEEGDEEEEEEEEPNKKEIEKFYDDYLLNEKSIHAIKSELAKTIAYSNEISDENLPEKALKLVSFFQTKLDNINNSYEDMKVFIKMWGGNGISYKTINSIKNSNMDFTALANEMQKNTKIKELIEKLGRSYISKEKIKSEKNKQINVFDNTLKSEVFGIHRSDDLFRILHSELLNLEDENLEYLFYSRLVEKNLISYDLRGKSTKEIADEEYKKKKGPIIACLDTSGSMNGNPIFKAKALMLAITKILQKEDRSLYIILFGGANEIKKLKVDKKNQLGEIISFLNSGFGGGTNFETPISSSIDILSTQEDYKKSDILMITDGLCSISDPFIKDLMKKKETYQFNIYTVLCDGDVGQDKFSDEILKI